MSVTSVGILGGGISGLSALHFCKTGPRASSLNVRLLESKSRVGGWANTAYKGADGKAPLHMFEKGPRSIRGVANGEITLGLVSDVGLASDILLPSAESSKRFLYMDGNVTGLPTSLLGAFQPPVSKYIPAILKDAILSRTSDSPDESIASFFERHVGTKATQEMLGGIVVGIYGGDMSKLSMQACFPTFADAGRQSGSLVRGMLSAGPPKSLIEPVANDLGMDADKRKTYEQLVQRVKKGGAMFSFKDGVGMLPDRLEQFHTSSIDRDARVARIAKGSKGGLDVFVNEENVPRSFDRLISSMPSYELADAIESASPNCSKLLRQIEFIDMAVVSLAFEEKLGESLIPEHLKGFGYLVPPIEKRPILGVSFDSITFPREGGLVRMAVMLGGDSPSSIKLDQYSNDQLLEIALNTVEQDLAIKKAPVSSDVFIARNAIPQYRVGHLDQVLAIESAFTNELPGIHLSGASLYGVSVNDCVASGMKAAWRASHPL